MLLHYYFIGIEHLMAQMVKNLLQYRRPRLNPLGRKIPGEGNGYPLQYSCLPAAAAKSLRLCPTLCDPIEGSPPGSPIPGILKARTLVWVAISSPMHEIEK